MKSKQRFATELHLLDEVLDKKIIEFILENITY